MKRITKPIEIIKQKTDPFKGVQWDHSTMRPGCLDAFKCPSRRGDELFEYRTPYLNASSSMQPLKDRT